MGSLTPRAIDQEQIFNTRVTFNGAESRAIDVTRGETVVEGLNRHIILCQNTTATTITSIRNGYDSQNLKFIGDGFTTLQANVAILLTTDLLLAANQVYEFNFYDGKWYPEPISSGGGGGGGGSVAWVDVTGKPSTFPPSAHTHVIADVTNFVYGSATVNFTNGDTVQRISIANAAVSAASDILCTVRRPNQLDESADRGYNYICNIVNVAAGTFDVRIICLDDSGFDPTPIAPNEILTLFYQVLP